MALHGNPPPGNGLGGGCGHDERRKQPKSSVLKKDKEQLGQVGKGSTGDLPLYAVYRIAKVLIGGDEEGEGDQEDDRRLVVQSKDVVVDAVVVELDQTTHRAEHVVHHLGES